MRPNSYMKKFFMTSIDSTRRDKPICTLEYMVWPIRTGRNVPMKIQCTNSFIVIVKIQNSLNSIRLPNVLHITMWMRWLWLGCIGECGPLPLKLGSNTTLRPLAVEWYCTPISQEIGPHSPMHPRQSQRILSFEKCIGNDFFIATDLKSVRLCKISDFKADHTCCT